jgi:succinate-semialdehyde dehydrogenase/glutarate-semialdehyde dehydrogenase
MDGETLIPEAVPQTPEYPQPKMYIGGEWVGVSGRRTLAVLNPATLTVLADLPLADSADLDRALAAAQTGFEQWRKVSAWDRGGILKRAADLLRERVDSIAELITLEEGKTLPESRVEVLRTADTFEWSGEEIRHSYGRVLPHRTSGVQQLVVEQPVGPVAAFAPWNFPVLTPGRKLAELLAAGCSCVVKPAEETPASFLAVVRACLEAGVSPKAINVVFGDPPAVSKHLIASPVIRKVSFTGSTPVGREIASSAGRHLKGVTLELGGHAPVIVFDDVDVTEVATLLARAKFRNAGQICVAPSRFYVHHKVAPAFTDAFMAESFSLQIGNGLNSSVEMGPVANIRRQKAMQDFVDDARTYSSATVISSRVSVPDHGYYWPPTLILDPPDESKVMREESFGPVAPITTFTDVDDALLRANSLGYGLGAYAFTRSLRTREVLSENLRVGMLAINSMEISTPESPFGGINDSGYGSEGGVEGLKGYLVTKYINQR